LFSCFMPSKFPFSLATIPLWKICQPFILWRALARAIQLLDFFCVDPFLCIVMFYKVFLSCIFPSFANDTFIIGSTFTIHLAFDHFVSQLTLMRLVI
jgi:hypothetical protein